MYMEAIHANNDLIGILCCFICVIDCRHYGNIFVNIRENGNYMWIHYYYKYISYPEIG